LVFIFFRVPQKSRIGFKTGREKECIARAGCFFNNACKNGVQAEIIRKMPMTI